MFSPRPLTLPHFQTIGNEASSSTPTFSSVPTHYAPHGYSGDGWRQMLLPIPTGVDPFRFLEELRAEWEEETRRLHRYKVAREDGSSIPRELEGSCEVLMGLPRDVWLRVAEALVGEGEAGNLGRVSRSFHSLLLPLLLRSPTLSSSSSLSSLTQHLTAHPSHIHLISSLSLSLTSNLDWVRAEELARTLQEGGGKVKKLALRCAGSDTGKASALFGCFRPETFEWTTSPCWLIRPARAFADLLRPWCEAEAQGTGASPSEQGPVLRTLRLSGFFLDGHLLEALLELGSLERLALTSKTVPANVLRGLLGDAQAASESVVQGEQQEQQCRLSARRLHLKEVQLLDLPRGSASQLLEQVDDLVSSSADDVAKWQSVTRQRGHSEDVILRRRM